MNMNLKFQESLRSPITTPVVFFVQTSTLDVCYAYRYILQSGMLLHGTRAVPRKIFRFRLYCSVFSASFSIRGIQNVIFFREGFDQHPLPCRRSYLSSLFDFGLVIVFGCRKDFVVYIDLHPSSTGGSQTPKGGAPSS